MTRLSAARAAGAVLVALASAPALACPEEGERVQFHSCHGAAKVELLLLPEEAVTLASPPEGTILDVTGGYTGADTRADGRPSPVGLFVDDGRVISPHLARMDGILIIERDGQPRIHRSTAVPLHDGVADLTDADQRLSFAGWAAERGISVMQSHLLITEGKLDVRPQVDSPKARRRMLFTDGAGWGVYQSTEALTLFGAAWELQQRLHPIMAINLDMGSFDYCMATRDGASAACGVVDTAQAAKLSNVLRFHRAP